MTRHDSLSEKERLFLATTMLSAEASLKELAADLDMREHAVRYIRDSLIDREIIRPVYHIDYFAVGFNDFGIYLSRGSENTSGRRKFEAQIAKVPSVFWLAKTGGPYQYALSFLTERPYELGDLFSAARPTESGSHFEKSFALRLDWTIYPPSYLVGDIKKRKMVTTSSRHPRVALDDIDRKVLRTLSANPTKTVAEVSRLAGMNTSSVAYRVEQLRKKGVLRTQRYLLNVDKLGFNGHRLIIVDRGLSLEQRQQFFALCSRHPNVVAFLCCTGDWDFEIRIEAESPNLHDQFCQLLFDTFGNAIGSIKTMQQLHVFKHVSFPDE